jgi:hypothetical protein
VGGLSGGFEFFWVMSTKIDRLWPKMASQPSSQFFKWGISTLPTGQFPQTAQWGVQVIQVGGSVVRIPKNVRNF